MDSFYSQFNPKDWQEPKSYLVYKSWNKLLDEYSDSSAQVLDLCCGPGAMTISLSKKYPSITGVDLEPKFISYANKISKEKNHSVKFVCADVRKLPFENNSFDVVISAGSSFNHMLTLNHQKSFLKETLRVLRKNGVAIIESGLVHIPKKYYVVKVKDHYEWWFTNIKNTDVTLKIIKHDEKSLKKILKTMNLNSAKIMRKKIANRRKYFLLIYKR